MIRTASHTRMIALAASTALASLALGGCTTSTAPRAEVSAGKAQAALEKGRSGQAIDHAEAAVLAEPRNPGFRAMLGAAYMEAGRFQSAATSFEDALALGDVAPRTALSLALAQIASGNRQAATATLDRWQDSIDPADLGLALALAGDTRRGTEVLAAQLRGGNNTPKIRQNLAYSLALLGDWRAARLMAAEDVPADQLDARLSSWAEVARPEDHHARVAALLSVPVVADSGQPAALALNNNPGTTGLALEAAQQVPAAGELPPVGMAQAEPAPGYPLPVAPRAEPARDFAAAFAGNAANAEPAAPARPVARPVAMQAGDAADQPVPAASPRPAGRQLAAAPVAAEQPAAASAASARQSPDTHLIQLGSFSSEASAKRAWGIYAKRYPQLSAHDMVITRAVVRGKTYWRVSAAGFGRASAGAMCSTVRRSGEGCIAWAANRPLPGAVDRGIRMAAR